MKILVVDAQGGGVGSRLIAGLRAQSLENAQIIAAGTNAAATAAMLKAGADAAATGENAVVYNSRRADLILGSLGILSANAMYGEIPPAMAAAVSGSDAVKILIPFSRCSVLVAGVAPATLESYIRQAVELAVQAVNGGHE